MSERDARSKAQAHHKHQPYDSSDVFDSNSKRPPVPGKESTQWVSDWRPSQMDFVKHKSSTINDAYCGTETETSCKLSSRPAASHGKTTVCPESRTSSGNNVAPSPPACLLWAHSLHLLLQDSDGVKLFMSYLESEGQQHADALHFWFACEGLKNEVRQDKIQRLIKVIYNTFFVKLALPINIELRREIAANLKSPQSIHLLEKAQEQIEDLINNTTYPNFLKSDTYLQYLQSVQNTSSGSGEFSTESSSSSGSISAEELLTNLASGLGSLPTLHEDEEFKFNPSVQHFQTPGTGSVSTGYLTPNVGGPIRLTKDMLLMSQEHRVFDVRPKTEAYGLFMNRGSGAHAAYNSYNPVSRQDSELQSLSSHSDVRTESDTRSIPDCCGDGRSLGRSSHRKLDCRPDREQLAFNREADLQQTVIPRTQKFSVFHQCPPSDPEQFMSLLCQKLFPIVKQQEAAELLDKKLKEVRVSGDEDYRKTEIRYIKERLQLDDDSDQDILDQHVSRVFSPAVQSPSATSPRPRSPQRSRYLHGSYMRPRRRENDRFSTFSSDSGNVHDFAESSDYKLAMVKSKSMPEYAEDRFNRGSTTRRSTSSKKPPHETDSGVSVLSDAPPSLKDSRVRARIRESDRSGCTSAGCPHGEMSRGKAASPAGRHRRHGSRSNSLERTGGMPTQPFIANPSLPPPPRPNTDVQLEEARKRLMEDEFRVKSRQRTFNRYPDMSQSNPSTLGKVVKSQRPQYTHGLPSETFTTIIFSFCDEQYPYRSKVPGTQITLRHFKDYLPKKGNYRFFFKTLSKDLDNQVIHEEVNNDSDVLPLFEGKIMALVKSFD